MRDELVRQVLVADLSYQDGLWYAANLETLIMTRESMTRWIHATSEVLASISVSMEKFSAQLLELARAFDADFVPIF